MLAKIQKGRLFFSFLSLIVLDIGLKERRNPYRRTLAKKCIFDVSLCFPYTFIKYLKDIS